MFDNRVFLQRYELTNAGLPKKRLARGNMNNYTDIQAAQSALGTFREGTKGRGYPEQFTRAHAVKTKRDFFFLAKKLIAKAYAHPPTGE